MPEKGIRGHIDRLPVKNAQAHINSVCWDERKISQTLSL